MRIDDDTYTSSNSVHVFKTSSGISSATPSVDELTVGKVVERSDVTRNHVYLLGNLPFRNCSSYACTATETRVSNASSAFVQNYRRYYTKVYDGPHMHGRGFLTGPPLNSYSTSYYKAISNAYSNLKGASLDSAVFTLEMGKSIEMIASRASSMFLFLKNLKRGNVRRAVEALGMTTNIRNSARDLSGSYLEFVFGWAPLMQDIVSAVEVLREPELRLPVVQTVGFSSDTFSDSDSITVRNTYPFYSGSGHHVNRAVTDEIFHRCKLIYTVGDPDAIRLTKLGLNNPLSVAWELMPYSFLIDYFFNLGDMLDQFTAQAGYNFVTGSITSTINSVQINEAIPFSDTPRITLSGEGSLAERHYFRTSRTKLTSGPAVLPTFSMPTSFKQAFNMAALIAQRAF